MVRITLILVLGFSILISFSVEAGNRDGYDHRNYRVYHNKHQQHHNKHRDCRHYSTGIRRHVCRHRSHGLYTGLPRFFTVPHVALGTRYGYSASGAVIVYQPYPQRGRRY